MSAHASSQAEAAVSATLSEETAANSAAAEDCEVTLAEGRG